MTAFDRTTVDELAASQPSWRGEQMTAALEAFQAQEAPSGAEEEWRYVELDFDIESFAPSKVAGVAMEPGPFLEAALSEATGHLTIVDGFLTGDVPTIDGVSIRRMQTLDALSPARGADRDKFASAHLAFAGDAVRIEVDRGVVLDRPMVVDIQATRADTMSFPHVEFSVGEQAEASVLVVYRSPDGLPAVVVPGITLDAGPGSNLAFQSVQRWGDNTSGLVHQRLRLGRDATGRIGEVGLGAKLGRLDLAVDLDGAGSSVEVVGIYFGEREQTFDYRMLINHVGRSTSSDVFLKGALEDSSQSVFTGLLRIEKDAVRSSAFETNRNLVLSPDAKAHSVPNLEILCDDVICGHGSSVGPLEPEQLYYLQSRGLSAQKAERLLVRGFFNEVIDRLPIHSVDGPVQQAVFARFEKALDEGRLA